MIRKSDFDPLCITYSQMNLIYNSQMYYVRLMFWIRAYIGSRFLGIGTADELFGRLYTEALEQSGMFNIHFGRETANRYSQLLGQFVILLRDYISARLAGNEEAVAQNYELLNQNISERAASLAAMNPYWNEVEYRELLRTFMEYILEIIDIYSSQDYDRDFLVYEHLRQQVFYMGYVLAEGLFNYVTSGADPGSLPHDEPCLTYGEMASIFWIRMFWFELSYWVRSYMISRYMGLGISDLILSRLRQVPEEFIGFMRQFFGGAVGDEYGQLFNNYIDLIDQFISAQIANDAESVNAIIQQLYQNAGTRAAFLASLNPYWDEAQWRSLIENNVRTTINESITFLTGNYPRNIEIFSSLLDQSENMSNAFGDGLLRYLWSDQGPEGIGVSPVLRL